MAEYVFSGKWITADLSVENRAAFYFRRDFTVRAKVETAVLYVCGLGLFRAEINRTAPDDTVLNPAQSQYSRRIYYREFDVTSLIREGENRICLTLGNGFYNECHGVWNWQNASWRNSPCAVCDLVLDYSDGSREILSSDAEWECTTDGPITANSIYLGETVDLRRNLAAAGWKNAIEVPAPSARLEKQEKPLLRIIGRYAPDAVRKLSDGAYVIVSPAAMTGYASIRFRTRKDERITVCYAESLKPDGHIAKTGNGEGQNPEWWGDNMLQQDVLLADGSEYTLTPLFSYKGFRYIEVNGYEGELRTEDVEICQIADDVGMISDFECSDPMLDKFHRIMRRTMLSNFQSKPTDTPVWEKNGWLGDANMALYSMLFNFDMSEYLPRFLNMMADCFDEFGSVPVIVPSSGWGADNSPVWNSIFVFGAEAMLDFYGKTEYVRALYPKLKAYAMQNIASVREDGFTWRKGGLSDWVCPMRDENEETDPNPPEGASICVTAFLYRMLQSAARIARCFGEGGDETVFLSAAEEIKDAFNARFLNVSLGIYETDEWNRNSNRTKYRQTSNLLPLAFGMVPEEQKARVLANLAEDIAARGYHLDTGCVGTRFLLPVLTDNGLNETAFRLLLQDTYPSWGYMLRDEALGCGETWENTARSRNHYFLGTYEEFFFTYLAGIRQVSDGFTKCVIRPVTDCPLTFVRASVRTPRGELSVRWQKEEGGIVFEVQVPEGCDVLLELSGRKVQMNAGNNTVCLNTMK